MPDHQLPDAVLWDLDGTLVDTEPAWIAAGNGFLFFSSMNR